MKVFNNRSHIITLLIILNSIYFFRLFLILKSGLKKVLEITPDDAFYYIEIAKSKSLLNIWSFDGINLTSGFHFLYANLIKLIYELKVDIEFLELFKYISILSIFFITFSFYLLSKVLTNLTNSYNFIIIFLIFTTYNILIQTTILMESFLVIFFSTVSIYLIFLKSLNKLKFLNLTLFFTGFFGTLSRTDFGVTNIFIFFYSLIFKNTTFSKRSLYTVLGSISSHLFLIVYNFINFGSMLQKSAALKLHWSSFYENSMVPILKLLFDLIFPFINFKFEPKSLKMSDVVLQAIYRLESYNKIFLILFAFFSIVIFIEIGKNFKKLNNNLKIVFLSSLSSILFYIIFYKFNSGGIQEWYLSNLLIPYSIALYLIISSLSKYMFAKNFLYLILIFNFSYSMQNMTSSIWVHHSSNYQISKIIDKNFNNENIGSWNSGIIGYFVDNNKIINLDGLVNDNVAENIVSGSLPNYLVENNINYLIDYEYMFINKTVRMRGGYEDEKFFSCLNKIDTYDSLMKWKNTNVVLLSFNKLCYEN